jgi:hypothetical protein
MQVRIVRVVRMVWLKVSGTVVRFSLQLIGVKPSFVVYYYIINKKIFNTIQLLHKAKF